MALSLARSPPPRRGAPCSPRFPFCPSPPASLTSPPPPPPPAPAPGHRRHGLFASGGAGTGGGGGGGRGGEAAEAVRVQPAWSLPAPEIEKLFAQCGSVKDVEVIKGKDGRNRGFAFMTMKTAEEAAAAVEKLNSSDVKGWTIKVEFSRSFRKPAPPPPPDTIVERHKLYVSNLPWKARAPNVKEFFSKFNPLSANVIFDNEKSAGYGFVSFGTKEEAEAALSELDGKELMGRPVRLKWRENADDKNEGVKADGEVAAVNVEGAKVDDASEDGGEDKQE